MEAPHHIPWRPGAWPYQFNINNSWPYHSSVYYWFIESSSPYSLLSPKLFSAPISIDFQFFFFFFFFCVLCFCREDKFGFLICSENGDKGDAGTTWLLDACWMGVSFPMLDGLACNQFYPSLVSLWSIAFEFATIPTKRP